MAKPSKGEVIRNDLVELIVSGRFPPGTQLKEMALTEYFGQSLAHVYKKVSRTPVREALHYVAALGLVVHRPNVGSTVVSPDPGSLAALFDEMVELECLCARLAARRLPDADREALRQGDDPEALAALVRAGVGNDRLQRLTEDTLVRLRTVWRMLAPEEFASLPAGLGWATAVVADVADGRGEAAAAALRSALEALRPSRQS